MNRYARSKGKDPDNLTVPEREELKTQMINELYPGKNSLMSYYFDGKADTSKNSCRLGQVAQISIRDNVANN